MVNSASPDTVNVWLKLTVWAVNTYVASYEGRDAEKSSPPAAAYSSLTRKGTKGNVSVTELFAGMIVV